MEQIAEAVHGRFASSASLSAAAAKITVRANRLARSGLLKRYMLGHAVRYAVTEAGYACCAKYGPVGYPARYA